jgi:hypothetical protein
VSTTRLAVHTEAKRLSLIVQPKQLNLKKIAELYGNGVTYDAVESQMRAVRKDAKALMDGSGREEIGQKRMIGDVGMCHS